MAPGRPDFEDLYREFLPRIHAFIRAQIGAEGEAEDVTSEVFLKAYRAYGRFEARYETPAAWLYTIARNAVMDHHRSHTRGQRALRALAVEPVATEDPASSAEDAMAYRDVLDALRTLPERQREVISLRHSGLSFAEVGGVLRCSQDAAKMAYHRALRTLRSRVER